MHILNRTDKNTSSVKLSSILLCGAFIAFFASLLSPEFAAKSYALTTAEELQQKIEERNRNIEALNKEIKEYSELVDKTGQQAQTLQTKIRQLEANAKAINLDIQKTTQKINVANLTIQKLGLNIEESENKIKTLQDGIEKSVRDVYMSEGTTLVETLLADRNISDFLFHVDNQLSFNSSVQKLIVQVRQEKQKVETSKFATESQKKSLVSLQTELSGKKKAVDYTKSEQNQILKTTKNQEKTYQKILSDKQALKAAFEKEVFEYESRLKYSGNLGDLPLAGSSPFIWPVEKVRITQTFGKTVAAKKLYVSGSHNGMDFGVPTGTKIMATASGVVMGTGDTDVTCRGASFGRWILIKHDNGLASTYAHLSVISVTKGQQVKTGDTIGFSGNTGYSTGPHLHISVYAADAVSVQNRPSASCGGKTYTMPISPVDAYLDPMLYFPTSK